MFHMRNIKKEVLLLDVQDISNTLTRFLVSNRQVMIQLGIASSAEQVGQKKRMYKFELQQMDAIISRHSLMEIGYAETASVTGGNLEPPLQSQRYFLMVARSIERIHVKYGRAA